MDQLPAKPRTFSIINSVVINTETMVHVQLANISILISTKYKHVKTLLITVSQLFHICKSNIQETQPPPPPTPTPPKKTKTKQQKHGIKKYIPDNFIKLKMSRVDS